MSLAPTMEQVERFRGLVARCLGLQFDESKLAGLERVLCAHAGADYPAYLRALETGGGDGELHRLAADLTVTETYFFRNREQIRAYAELALPARLLAREGRAPRVLSAGCASGEEPYTLAIAAREGQGLGPGQIEIDAIDANPAMLAKAARASYSAWSLRELGPAARVRWFDLQGEQYVLHDGVRQGVRFDLRNLARDDAELWAPARYDIVFCRNVLMYFTPAQAQAAVARIAHSLVADGYLFLGHAETLRGLSNDFHLCHTHDTFYYQRKQHTAELPAVAATPPWGGVLMHPPPLGERGWVDEIARAAQRIDALAMAQAPAGTAAPVLPDLHLAMACLHRERYDQTLAQIEALPAAQSLDPDVLLLKALSLSQSGAGAQAQEVCHQLLERDELNAGAHYVLALCREDGADPEGALAHYRSAAYLDPGFAMARLHIGVLERRMGEAGAARRDLAQALILLEHEEPARLLLFGGGFPRGALISLCRAELAALGGRP